MNCVLTLRVSASVYFFVVVILPVLGLLVVPYSEEHMPCMVVDISRIL